MASACYGTFVFGYDGDTPQSFARTVEFARDHGFYIAAFNHLTPFPGTALYQRLEQEQRLRYEAWWTDPAYSYNVVPFTPAGNEREEVERGCVEARRSFYSWRASPAGLRPGESREPLHVPATTSSSMPSTAPTWRAATTTRSGTRRGRAR
jgi:radical SAM superfamily enzyme YgiQ (UPF0313 family)